MAVIASIQPVLQDGTTTHVRLRIPGLGGFAGSVWDKELPVWNCLGRVQRLEDDFDAEDRKEGCGDLGEEECV